MRADAARPAALAGPDQEPIRLSGALHDRLVTTIVERFPVKTFGYLLAERPGADPVDFVLFDGNVRNDRDWQPRFHAYGRYFVEHDDAGFVASPEECWRAQQQIWRRGLVEVGVFHSHQRHPANFSRIDYELHTRHVSSLWHLIVSLRSPGYPRLRAFSVSAAGVVEREVHVEREPFRDRDAVVARGRELLRLDRRGLPAGDPRLLVPAVDMVVRLGDREVLDELLADGFLRGSEERYAEHVAPAMVALPGGRFEMGTNRRRARHFCGECPAHEVVLSPFQVGAVAVTNELLAVFDERRRDLPAAERARPATNVSWSEAVLFALWMGCRLPTEAEWEYACGAGSDGEWCCRDEERLADHAWYSENAAGAVHDVATRAPNRWGLHDLHGNAWEWCADAYDADFYARSPAVDPLDVGGLPGEPASPHKVCRGGSVHALAEMCRTRYRQYEPADFRADDLGLRLARSAEP